MRIGFKHLRLDANLHASKTGARYGFPASRRFIAIDEQVGMMNIALVPGTNLHRLHPLCLGYGHTENEIPVRVRALRWKDEWFFRLKNHVGRSHPTTTHQCSGRI